MFVNSISLSSSLPTAIKIYFPVHFPLSWPRKTWKWMYAMHEHTNPDSQIPSGDIHIFIWALSFPQKQQQISFLRLGEIRTKRAASFLVTFGKTVDGNAKVDGWCTGRMKCSTSRLGVLVMMMMKEILKWMHVVRRPILNVCDVRHIVSLFRRDTYFRCVYPFNFIFRHGAQTVH